MSSQTLLLFHLQKSLVHQSAAWFTGGLWEILSEGGNVEPEWWWRNVLRSEQGLAISVRWDSWQKGLSRKNRLVTEGREERSVLRPWDAILSHPQEKKQPNFWRTWRRKGWYSCKAENGDEGTQKTLRPGPWAEVPQHVLEQDFPRRLLSCLWNEAGDTLVPNWEARGFMRCISEMVQVGKGPCLLWTWNRWLLLLLFG